MGQQSSRTVNNVLALAAHSRAAARAAGLRYVDDRGPGIRRERRGSGFVYFDSHGKRIMPGALLTRIRALVIPPAWKEVWISPHADAHLQATGRDARGRKQYRYHSSWSQTRSVAKHERMCDFAACLGELRQHCQRALGKPGLPREKVMAAMLRIVDLTAIRVGHEEYVRDNASFGLTTLRKQHVRIRGSEVQLRFRGKSGIMRALSFRDRRLAKLIAACRALKGPQLFQYVDESGRPRRIDASHLNAHLHALVSPAYSIKDFRNWSATVRVAVALSASERATSQRAAKRTLLAAVRQAAEHLGNTPTVCRNSYVHPLIVDAYLAGKTLPVRSITAADDHTAHEQAVRLFLQQLIRDDQRKRVPARAGLRRTG